MDCVFDPAFPPRGRAAENAILSVIAFFAIGMALLSFVNVERGRAIARVAEAGLRLAGH